MKIQLTLEQIKRINDLNRLKSAVHSARIEGNPLTFEEAKAFLLSKKQEKIYNLIKINGTVQLRFIRKHFKTIPERTLRYDLKKLVDSGLIIKIGKTRGSYYRDLM